jgi:hypothetical protein
MAHIYQKNPSSLQGTVLSPEDSAMPQAVRQPLLPTISTQILSQWF